MKKSITKKKTNKVDIKEQLELTGNESASQLYSAYIKHYTSSSKLTDKMREVWKKAYYQEKRK